MFLTRKDKNIILQSIQRITITQREQQMGGHGPILKEKGFYPIGHLAGIVVMSYFDPDEGCIVYEKYVIKERIEKEEIEKKLQTLHPYERIISFE